MSAHPPGADIRDTAIVDRGGGGRRPAIVGLALAGAAAAAALLFLFVVDPLLLADDPGPEPVAAPAPADDDETQAGEEEADPEVQPAETVEVFLARDPFQPVRPEPEPEPDPDDPPPKEDDERPDEVERDRRLYVLIDVFLDDDEPQAIMEIDGERHTVSEGDVLLEDPQVRIQRIRLDDGCVDFLHGDVRDTVCEGERVLK